MELNEFKDYVFKITKLLNEVNPNQPVSIYVSDYLRGISTNYGIGKVIYDLADICVNTLKNMPNDECDFAHLSEMAYIIRSNDFNFGNIYKTQAYFFTLCLFAASQNKININDIDCEDFDVDEFQKFSVTDLDVENELDPIEKKLNYYRLRLLDFSRSNPLVNFKKNRTSALQFFSPQIGTLMHELSKKKTLKITKWSDNQFQIIYRCKICGRYHFESFNPFDPLSKPSIECPVCDLNNTHHRKSMIPLEEDMQFAIDEYTCKKCGKVINIDEIKNGLYECPDCHSPIELKSFPIVSTDNINNIIKKNDKKPFMICSLSDKNLAKIIGTIQGRAQTMEKNFGLHVLYLACGFLEWKDINGTNYNSPILLCPIHFKNENNSFSIEIDSSSEHVFEFNKTLLHMLKGYSKEYAIYIEPPKYNEEDGMYGTYFSTLESYLKNDKNVIQFTKDWQVHRTLGISLFHYQKLQLESDMTKYKDIYLNHPMIRRICGDENQEILSSQSFIQNSFPYILFDADSSQENVINKALEGKSYILEGPPGSGKSQTISNIIAMSIGSGKSVLFVTEKATARTIIYENLKEKKLDSTHSLTDYILDFNQFHLRGGSIPRSTFIEELNRVVKLDDIAQSSNFFDVESKEILEQYIKNYQKEFSTMDESRNSFMGILNKIVQYAKYPILSSFKNVNCDLYTLFKNIKKYYQDVENKIVLFDYRKDPLYLCLGDIDGKFVYNINQYINIYDQGSKLIEDINNHLHLKLNENNRFEYQYIINLLNQCFLLSPLKEEMLNQIIILGDLDKYKTYLVNRKNEMNEYLPYYDYQKEVNESLINQDIITELNQKMDKYSSKIKRISRNYYLLKKQIKLIFKNNIVIKKYEDVQNYVHRLNQYFHYIQLKCQYEEKHPVDHTYLGYIPQNITSWQDEIDKIDLIMKIHQVMNEYIPSSITSTIEFLENYLSNVYQKNMAISKKIFEEANNIFDNEAIYLNKLQNYFVFDLNNNMKEIVDKLNIILENQNRLVIWQNMHQELEWFKDYNVLPLLNEIVDKNINNNNNNYYYYCYDIVEKAIYHSYYQKLLDEFIVKHSLSTIKNFDVNEHIDNLRKYAKIDENDLEHAKSYLYDRLYSLRIEASNKLQQKSKLLSNRTGYSIKKLIDENWQYIKYIKPCFMMSPLNVSQYIDINNQFDLVIFDEASQIFTEDALAAIVRGKQIIIVGDSKQLPPCDFFRAQDVYQSDQEDLFEDDENQENSILNDATKALGDISIQLNWHYRSYDESLIAFSNEHFNYNLITFPAAIKEVNDGIEYISVPYDQNLCYSAGKTGTPTNKNEARVVVETLWREIIHPERNKYSLGVVAFSNAQAETIKEEWFEFRKDSLKDAVIKVWEEKHEEIIFCNLDTMQGDERDTMLISICYSPDKNDKFLLTYLGRIRLASGKKRLNVAITRARHRMIVISMLENQRLRSAIEESLALEENKEGAKSLYDFLEYASSFKNENNIPTSSPSNDIVKSICECLDEEHISYDTEIGRSKCKINIGIKSLPFNGNYSLGIIVDDPTRTDFDSPREYARLTEKILRNKYNWDIYRIYPISWVNNYEQEKAKLLKKIHSI